MVVLLAPKIKIVFFKNQNLLHLVLKNLQRINYSLKQSRTVFYFYQKAKVLDLDNFRFFIQLFFLIHFLIHFRVKFSLQTQNSSIRVAAIRTDCDQFQSSILFGVNQLTHSCLNHENQLGRLVLISFIFYLQSRQRSFSFVLFHQKFYLLKDLLSIVGFG